MTARAPRTEARWEKVVRVVWYSLSVIAVVAYLFFGDGGTTASRSSTKDHYDVFLGDSVNYDSVVSGLGAVVVWALLFLGIPRIVRWLREDL